MLHGRAAADEAAETARKTFEQGAAAEGLPTVYGQQAGTLPTACLCCSRFLMQG